MRFGGTGTPGFTSTLFQALAADLANPVTRNQITLLSMDLNRPGVMPYLWQKPNAAPSNTTLNGQTGYTYDANLGYPTIAKNKPVNTPWGAQPPVNYFAQPPAPQYPGDFDVATSWCSTVAALQRVTVNRYGKNLNAPPYYLPSYPDPDADKARQNLAHRFTRC